MRKRQQVHRFFFFSSLPSYIKDTLDLLKHIKGHNLPPGALLVTIDVEALYLSIPHEKGVQMARSFLMEQPHTQWKFNEFLLRLLYHILTHNWFTFRGSHYLQVQGIAMCTCCAHGQANLYLGVGNVIFGMQMPWRSI